MPEQELQEQLEQEQQQAQQNEDQGGQESQPDPMAQMAQAMATLAQGQQALNKLAEQIISSNQGHQDSVLGQVSSFFVPNETLDPIHHCAYSHNELKTDTYSKQRHGRRPCSGIQQRSRRRRLT